MKISDAMVLSLVGLMRQNFIVYTAKVRVKKSHIHKREYHLDAFLPR